MRCGTLDGVLEEREGVGGKAGHTQTKAWPSVAGKAPRPVPECGPPRGNVGCNNRAWVGMHAAPTTTAATFLQM